uniref:Uncharacterized protein n=1 Tax=Zea mays TaxID=4577 RepID=C0P3T2_MAIZE|nr:unknown [Zea mays]
MSLLLFLDQVSQICRYHQRASLLPSLVQQTPPGCCLHLFHPAPRMPPLCKQHLDLRGSPGHGPNSLYSPHQQHPLCIHQRIYRTFLALLLAPQKTLLQQPPVPQFSVLPRSHRPSYHHTRIHGTSTMATPRRNRCRCVPHCTPTSCPRRHHASVATPGEAQVHHHRKPQDPCPSHRPRPRRTDRTRRTPSSAPWHPSRRETCRCSSCPSSPSGRRTPRRRSRRPPPRRSKARSLHLHHCHFRRWSSPRISCGRPRRP